MDSKGLWDLKIKGLHNNNTDYIKNINNNVKQNMTAVFNANFTMIKLTEVSLITT